ncbi:MAG: sporulation peptidase YabG [Clostridiales bacterium GWC2_40_7]|nr:MAG: sporulation peptidase YabG [Clostridiales bacterium GWC2_40_7]
MGDLKIGDIVARKSYGCDVFFKIVDIKSNENGNILTLKGISYRIEADAPEGDLELQPEQKVREYRDKCCRAAEKNSRDIYASRYRGYSKKAYYRDTSKDNSGKFQRPGKILHLDGDNDYLETCIGEYSKLGLSVTGQFISEKEQPARVFQLLKEYRPDILVLTGHDGYIKGSDSYTNLRNYRNSKYFIDAVKEARKYEPDLDSLVIFAGACQSLYYEIIKAGANFASAPFRDLIHALDPVRVCQKIAFAGIDKVLNAEEVIENTITGKTGIGGVQTRGKYREGFPIEPYQ